tara:strand:+ start:16063 stop:16899 length:837 start_codon:yes stop_codon:yes gene_type:complete
MSHFTVLIIGGNIEDQLEGFNEDITMPRYEKGEVSEEDKKQFVDYYTKAKEANKNLTFEELYEKEGKGWNDNSWKFRRGIWVETSTYNPNSKWDWYKIGGRWEGMLMDKQGNPCNSGLISELDFLTPRVEAEETALKYFDEVSALFKGGKVPQPKLTWEQILGAGHIGDIDTKRKFYHNQTAMIEIAKVKEENRDKFGFFFEPADFKCTREEYGKRAFNGAFSTYAMLKDGEWFEKGQMGWWGMSNDEFTQADWDIEMNKMLDSLEDDVEVTIVDCHI